jgi:hypothetical protein
MVMDGNIPAPVRNMLDRQAILDCVTRLARGIDRMDTALVLSAYHPDAIDDHGVFVGPPEGFWKWYLESAAAQAWQSHHLTSHSCEITGDVAHAETYYICTTASDGVMATSGRYVDRLERRNGEWKITMRYCLVDWTRALPGPAYPYSDHLADRHANGVPSRGPEDPSYRRPMVNKRALTVAG